MKIQLILMLNMIGCFNDQINAEDVAPWPLAEEQKISPALNSGKVEDAVLVFPAHDDRRVSYDNARKRYCNAENITDIKFGAGMWLYFIIPYNCLIDTVEFPDRNILIKINNITNGWIKLNHSKVYGPSVGEQVYLYADELTGYSYKFRYNSSSFRVHIMDIVCSGKDNHTDFAKDLYSIELALEDARTKEIFFSNPVNIEKDWIVSESQNYYLNIPGQNTSNIFVEMKSYCDPP